VQKNPIEKCRYRKSFGIPFRPVEVELFAVYREIQIIPGARLTGVAESLDAPTRSRASSPLARVPRDQIDQGLGRV
jgi:hypothetical protein